MSSIEPARLTIAAGTGVAAGSGVALFGAGAVVSLHAAINPIIPLNAITFAMRTEARGSCIEKLPSELILFDSCFAEIFKELGAIDHDATGLESPGGFRQHNTVGAQANAPMG